MKRVLALLLLLAAVSAQCMLTVESVESKFNATKDLPAVMCTQADADTTLYTDFAELAEQYNLAGECFDMSEFDNENAGKYYALAGDHYTKAAQSICGDYNIQAALYESAGDAYYSAFYITDEDEYEAFSKQAYGLALTTYQYHRSIVTSFNEAKYNAKMGQFDSLFVTDVTDFQPEGNMDLFIFSVAAILIIGIILIAFFIGKH